jgi:uncharacterized protein YjbJ (UPF0337 family)
MNKDQLKGSVKDTLGKLQRRAGKAIGSTSQEAKGMARQSEGRLQKADGDLREALKNSRHT